VLGRERPGSYRIIYSAVNTGEVPSSPPPKPLLTRAVNQKAGRFDDVELSMALADCFSDERYLQVGRSVFFFIETARPSDWLLTQETESPARIACRHVEHYRFSATTGVHRTRGKFCDTLAQLCDILRRSPYIKLGPEPLGLRREASAAVSANAAGLNCLVSAHSISNMVKNRPEYVCKLFKINTLWSASRVPLHQHASLTNCDRVQVFGRM